MTRLSNHQIDVLWREFEVPGWADWQREYVELVTWASAASDDDLRGQAGQHRLWDARAVTRMVEESTSDQDTRVEPFPTDEEVVAAVVALRGRSWPAHAGERAKAIEDEYGRILRLPFDRGLLGPADSLVRAPAHPLQRLFCVLLPEQTCIAGGRRSTKRLLLGRIGNGPLHSQVMMRHRLRDALGVEQDLVDHVRRSMFCYWLFANYTHMAAGKMPPWEE